MLKLQTEPRYDTLRPKLEYVLFLFNRWYRLPRRELTVSYGGTADAEIQISPGDWTEFYGDTHPVPEEVTWIEWEGKRLPLLCQQSPSGEIVQTDDEDDTVVVTADILGTAFYFLSCWQEWMSENRDQYGRFPASESLLYRWGLLDTPEVKYYFDILAAFGLQYVLDLDRSEWQKHLKLLGGVAGGLVAIAGVTLVLGNQFTLMKGMEAQQYQEQVLQMIKNARLDLLKVDALRVIIFMLFIAGGIYVYLREYIGAKVLVPILVLLMIVDMYGIDRRYLREFVPQTQTEQAITKTQVDNYILQDQGLFRVFPVGNLFSNDRWAYFHQSIGGYHAAKMFNYQKMIEENLYQGTEQGNSINWNIVKMLNVKYLVAEGQIPSKHLNVLGQDPQRKWVLHEVNNPSPRAWMVYKTRIVEKTADQRKILNQKSFNPMEEAVVGSPVLSAEPRADSVASRVEVTKYNANTIELRVNTAKEGLLVLSENYLPIWWTASLDGNTVPIHRVNSFQRGVVITAGEYSLSINLEATTFHTSIISANIFLWIAHAILAFFLLWQIPAVRTKLSRRTSE